MSSKVATQMISMRHYETRSLVVNVHMIIPALFFFSSSFRRSSNFSWNFLPVYSISRTLTGSLGRGGCSFPQTMSTRLSLTPTSVALDFFFSDSESFRASATTKVSRCLRSFQGLDVRAAIMVGSIPTVLPPSDCWAVLLSFSQGWTSLIINPTILAT